MSILISTTCYRKVQLREKRIATFNPKLAEKQTLEINKQVEKAIALKAAKAKKQNTATVRSMLLLLQLTKKDY